jgi:hypothetical protein
LCVRERERERETERAANMCLSLSFTHIHTYLLPERGRRDHGSSKGVLSLCDVKYWLFVSVCVCARRGEREHARELSRKRCAQESRDWSLSLALALPFLFLVCASCTNIRCQTRGQLGSTDSSKGAWSVYVSMLCVACVFLCVCAYADLDQLGINKTV